MDSSPPIKPPRGVKHVKETSGLLMSVIRTLSSSETNEQRDKEKAKLEAEYKVSDRKLDDLISSHETDLNQVMQLFGNFSTQVYESKAKIQKVKESLKTCKSKLNCRRDELKKLWQEGLEHKYMIQFLEEIEKINEIPHEVTVHLSQKRYLSATNLLIEGVNLSNGNLEKVEGLKELTSELHQRKDQLHLQILQELKQQLYIKPSHQVLSLRRQESTKDGVFNSSFRRSNELRVSVRQRNAARRNVLETSKKLPFEAEEFNVFENCDKHAAVHDTNNFIAVMVKCLALLNKLTYVVNEVIKKEIENELLYIIHKTTNHINDFISTQNGNETKLTEFVQTLFDVFKEIGNAHQIFLEHVNKAIKAHKIDFQPYEMQFYWSKVETVLKMVLNDYLDIQNSPNNSQQSNTFNSNDISLYFSRKKPQMKKKSMFQFDYAQNTMTINNFQRDGGKNKDKILVCAPNSNNIMIIFIPFVCFTEELEQISNVTEGTHCGLYDFLCTNAGEHFLKMKTYEIEMQIYEILKAPDAWKSTTLLDVTTDYKPLLVSTLNVERCINEWQDVLKFLPLFSENIVENICKTLKQYKDECINTYQSIVQPDDRRICSAAWLKDEDISRFLKSLPNWVNLKAQQEFYARSDRRRMVRREHTLEEESPEDVRQRNRKEAEILAGNLGEGGINSSEIISDMNLLKELAQLQESMEWFSVRVLQFASELRKEPTLSPTIVTNKLSDAKPNVSPSLLTQLTSIGQDFDELANTCLLLLHLEVRVQCFHYLLAQHEYNKETHEPDPKVLELSRVLANVDEAMTSCLHPRKCKYIFEGLGHLIAKILISSCQFMQVIDEPAIQRMSRNLFALQQTLTNITMTREVALDYARHYFELFFLTPEEILNDIVERGAEYSELEYMNAIQLLHRSKKGKKLGDINENMKKLSDILEQVGVTV